MTTIRITDRPGDTTTISALEDGGALIEVQSDGQQTSAAYLSPAKARKVIAALQAAVDEVDPPAVAASRPEWIDANSAALLRLAAEFLDSYSKRLGADGCNDWAWPKWVTKGTREMIEEVDHDLNPAGWEPWNGRAPANFTAVSAVAEILRVIVVANTEPWQATGKSPSAVLPPRER